MRGLAEKGHDVTIIAAFKEKSPIKNYRTVLIEEAAIIMEGEKWEKILA